MDGKQLLLKRFKNWLIYLTIKFGLLFILKIKRITAFKFFETLGRLGYYLVLSERKKTITNLKLIFGNKYTNNRIKKMAKEVFINLARNTVDAFRITTFRPDNIDNFVLVRGLEKIDRCLAKGRGLLLLTGHIGNWELLGACLALKGYPLSVVGAPIYDSRLDEIVVKNRMSVGLHYIARGAATREILRCLKRNEMIGLLIDQDSSRIDGVFVDFLGKDAYTPVGPVLLAIKTGAPLLPIAIHIRKNNTHVVEIGDEIQLRLTGNREIDRTYNTLQCSKAIEQFIAKYPTQWVWMHERWKTKKINKANQ